MTRAASAVGYPNPANSSSHERRVLILRNATPTLLTQPLADSHQYALLHSDRVADSVTRDYRPTERTARAVIRPTCRSFPRRRLSARGSGLRVHAGVVRVWPS